MNIRLNSLCVMLSMLAFLPSAVLGVNKCTDATGRLSDQNEPCPAPQSAVDVQSAAQSPAADSTDAESTSGEVGSVVLDVPGIGNVGVMTFNDWKVQVREGAPASTIKMNGWVMSIQLTFIPRSSVMDEEAQKDNVRKMGERYVSTSVEQGVQLRRLGTGIGPAILANFNERKHQGGEVPVGEYSSITIGQINHELMTVAVTILTNGPDTVQHDNALLVLESILLL
jgi:hypothetical protein